MSLFALWAPVIRGHGIPEAMEAVLTRQSRIAPRAAVAKPLSAAIAIGTGGPFGAEGPIIVTGGALGSLIGQVIRVTPSERKILLACGAAAGMSATFGAPLAAVVLAIELLLFEFSHRAFVPLVVASSVAGAMHAALFSAGPLFHVPPHNYAGLSSLPVFGLVGIACGLLAVVICKGLYLVEGGFRRLPISEFWHPILGALGFACVGLVVPRALGVGYDAINDVLANKLAVGVLAALLVAKLVAWWIALGSGTSGARSPRSCSSAARSAACSARSSTTSTPACTSRPARWRSSPWPPPSAPRPARPSPRSCSRFELTRDYRSILPIMLAAVIADLVAGALLDHGLMTEKLARRGLHVPLDYQPDYLQATPSAPPWPPTSRSSTRTTTSATRAAASTAPSTAPTRSSTRTNAASASSPAATSSDRDATADAPLSQIASPDVVTVTPDDTLLTALERIIDEEVEHLPVLDAEQRIVGMCTRTDILRARSQHLTAEHSQQGWHAAWRQTPGR